jgi:undecaprenyl-diphosphatase
LAAEFVIGAAKGRPMQLNTIVDALILGVVEGVTEFIPVSSTAHLLLAERVLGFTDATSAAFAILIQFGAILALLAVYAGRLIRLVADLPRDRRTQRFALGVVIAFIPAAILGVLFHRIITEVLFRSTLLICLMLILGGIVLLFIDRLPIKPRQTDVMDYPLGLSLGIGLFQCLALIPGVSRSGATIVGAMLLGADKRSAAEFSFFLAMPTMLGAFVYDLHKNAGAIDMSAAAVIAIGFIAAFVSALIVVRTFLGFVSRHGFGLFGWWRIVVGAVGIAAVLTFGDGAPQEPLSASGGAAPLELAARAEAYEIVRHDGGDTGRLDIEAGERPALGLGRL